MPIPKVKKGKQQRDYILRCVPELMQYHKRDEALAICYDTYRKNVELESYSDYPQSATNNAKRAIAYKEKNGSKCGTTVGWTRARQLANRESLTRDTIARMASFKRHQQNKDVPYTEGCGGIMWDAWGGSAGINWAISKLKQIDKK